MSCPSNTLVVFCAVSMLVPYRGLILFDHIHIVLPVSIKLYSDADQKVKLAHRMGITDSRESHSLGS